MPSTKRKRPPPGAMSEGEETAQSVRPATPCDLTARQPARVQIGDVGDLCLKVGSNRCTIDTTKDGPQHYHEYATIYVVNWKIFSSSAIWEALLKEGFAESKQPELGSGQDWIAELPEDDPEAMLIILNIIHNRYGGVPKGERAISIHSLYRLTVLTDKYGLASLLQPWAQTWTKGLKDELPGNKKVTAAKPSLTLNCLERLLWIAWELGYEQLFKGVYGYLVPNTTVEEGHLIEKNFKTKLFSTGTLKPPAICEHIRADRERIISKILGLFNTKINSLVFSKSQFCYYYKKDNYNCEVNKEREISSIFDPKNVPLPENFKTHLEAQAKKCGMDQQS
ncbi:hypothetical protein DL769_006022 [Monosporascus sp. CRB-8-3]|nr:hypothetical protein DL769_006022 [Monosporascus sp. CRB-8-3]